MRVDSNRWNRLRYSVWAPVYDLVGGRFDGKRRESLRLLDVQAGERVLVVGAGTGGDLPYLPAGCQVVATDLTFAMLTRARSRLRSGSHLAVMDGHQLALPPSSVDAVVLHLLLAVIPDPVRCLQEVERVLRPGGRAVIFDKFVRGTRPPLVLRAINLATRVLFTEVTRNLEQILVAAGGRLTVEYDASALFGGLFRMIVLRKAK
jgi:phosphatidylethanolamine/phosphatidyl-N-methylethanolamine N-methyltransferase